MTRVHEEAIESLASRNKAGRRGKCSLWMKCLLCVVPFFALGMKGCEERPPELGPISSENYISNHAAHWSIALVANGAATPLVVSSTDFPGVVRVAGDLQADIERVTTIKPELAQDTIPAGAKTAVIIGTIGKSALIDGLIAAGKLDVSEIQGKWETHLIQPVEKPAKGVDRAIVIVGSDQRGTIFGAYDVSKNIGVSPWYYWDDVPAKQQSALYVKHGRFSQGTPAVKFRGFFINDENPTTGRWAKNTFGEGKAVISKPTCTTSGCTWADVAYPGGLVKEYWGKVFEVALRLRANYFWPAVWGRQFAYDDPENLATVAKYGIVYGTSHEAPMGRGIEEWNSQACATTYDSTTGAVAIQGIDAWGGNGDWSWVRNPNALKAYWQEGIQRIKDTGVDAVVTLAMRGTNDFPSTDFAQGATVMADVLANQKTILNNVLGEKQATAIPKVWLLYKEVQTYWDTAQGSLRPPDDVTVVWCDDNWGNMRKLQAADEPARSGGYGIYYHFDYVGASRDYKWIDTNLLPNIWEQLNLVYSYGVDRLWLVNVGDMKNEEVPLQFFLDYAWNPQVLTADKIPDWEKAWAAQQFGSEQAEAIAEVIHDYANLQSDRKPELLNRRDWLDAGGAVVNSDQAYFSSNTDPALRTYYDANPFSLTHYREMETVVAQWEALAAKAEAIKSALPAAQQDAFYGLVYYEVKASANLYELRLAQFKNILYAAQGRASTNDWATIANARFADDQAMSDYYNNTLAGGKWLGWQTQPKIGYGDQDRYGTTAPWQQPERNNDAIADAIFPLLKSLDVSGHLAEMGVTIDGALLPFDGSKGYWTDGATDALPTFSPHQTQPAQYIEIFNRGSRPFEFDIGAPAWLTVTVTPNVATIDSTNKEVRAVLEVNDWASAKNTTITVTGNGQTVEVPVVVKNTTLPTGFAAGFVESNGYVSMEAEHYSRVVNASPITWTLIPDIGRTGSGLTPFPVDADPQTPTAGGSTPRLEYDVYLSNAKGNKVTVVAYLSPRNNVKRNAVLAANGKTAVSVEGEGLRYAVSIDDGDPRIVDINVGNDDIFLNGLWGRNTGNNVNVTSTTLPVSGPGIHTVKLWMVDPNVIVQKLVVDTGTGELGASYFGPPESYRVGQ